MENYVILDFAKTDCHDCDNREHLCKVAINGKWIAEQLNEDTLDSFLDEYTTEDVEQLLPNALLEGAVAFIYDPDDDDSFEYLDSDSTHQDSSWKYRAFAEILSQLLQDDGHDDASKFIDCLLDL